MNGPATESADAVVGAAVVNGAVSGASQADVSQADVSGAVVSRALAAELATKVRERGIVLWVDGDKRYSRFVEGLGAGAVEFPYPVVAFRGSFLELMLALKAYGNGLRREHVLVHLGGLTKESVKETPVLELYRAGTVFEKSLGTLVREASVGRARPDEVEDFLGGGGVTLEAADAWLASLQAVPRDGLTLELESLGVEGVVMRLIEGKDGFAAHLPEGHEELLAYLEKNLGLTSSFRRFVVEGEHLDREKAARLVASWLMAVEFVHDLRAAPVTEELRALRELGPFAKECRRLVARLRERLPEDYEYFAAQLQDRLQAEREAHAAEVLGATDTFRFEETTIREEALQALRRGQWDAAGAFARERTPEQSFWVRRSPSLQRTWELVRLAASTGRAIEESRRALQRCASLEEAVERYVARLAPVDRQHRVFEQRAHALPSDLEDYDALLEVRGALRRAYRRWADETNRAFFDLCVKGGALPSRGFQQRSLYEEVVQPLVEQGGRTAFVLVDALRFEMAQGLAEELSKEKVRVSLTARLAELPTITAVGMNALAPVERDGRLRLLLDQGSPAGFVAREFAVKKFADRVRAIEQRSLGEGALDMELADFLELDGKQLEQRVKGKPLIVVRSLELDTAGEHALHLGTFEQTLTQLKSAISRLRRAGVDRFVITSDHGFLLQDPTTDNVPFGVSKRVPKRRHALLAEPSGMADVLEVKLSALGYEVEGCEENEDLYLVLRPDTALWQTKDKVAPFVHGGNSLQERVIPVLVLEPQGGRGRSASKYEVVARAIPAHLGRQRLQVAVRLQSRENAALSFASPKTIRLALRVPGRSDVSVTLLDVGPPASRADAHVSVPPNQEEALVEFELEGAIDEKVRVELFHPDGVEEVAPKLVEGFFDVARSRRLGKASKSPSAGLDAGAQGDEPRGGGPLAEEREAPAPESSAAPREVAPAQRWQELVEDPAFRQVLEIIEERRSINEAELLQVLGSPRRVRAFSRRYDELTRLVPFEIEVATVNGMKAYSRKS